MDDYTIPLKRCSRGDACVHPEGSWLPETREYFSPAKLGRNGLRSYCKRCQAADARGYRGASPENLERSQERSRLWRKKNPDAYREVRRKYLKKPDVMARERERGRAWYSRRGPEVQREWRAKKPWLYRLFWNLRMARKRSLPDTLTTQEWQATIRDWGYSCAVCGARDDITADHWIPLSAPDCPGTTKNNMIPLCGSCNYSKSDKDALDWMSWRFGRDFALERYELITAYLAQF